MESGFYEMFDGVAITGCIPPATKRPHLLETNLRKVTKMCEELNKELTRSKVLATILAEHLDDMKAANCEIPVEARGKKFICKCEIEKPKSVACPDIDGKWVVGGVKFKERQFAEEFAKALNDNKVIYTPIGFHSDECCGCAGFYFSVEKQEMIAICNECGLRRELLMNSEEQSIIGPTVSFKEN